MTGNDNDDITKFSFGKWRLYYWQNFKTWNCYVRRASYSNLKEECLNNKFHKIELHIFNQIITNAYLFLIITNALLPM